MRSQLRRLQGGLPIILGHRDGSNTLQLNQPLSLVEMIGLLDSGRRACSEGSQLALITRGNVVMLKENLEESEGRESCTNLGRRIRALACRVL